MCCEASWTASFPIVMFEPNASIWPQPGAGQPQKERGVTENGAWPSSPLSTVSYLWPPVNVYKAGPASSWSVQRPALSLGSCFLLVGQGCGTVTGRKNPAPCCLGNPTSPILPCAVPGSASPLAGAGMSSWDPASTPGPGHLRLQAERGGRYF